MSLDLNKLANKLDETLSNETTETLTKFLTNKRMSNNKQSSLEFYAKNEKDLRIRYLRGEMPYYKYCEKKDELLEKAKAMHKDEVTSFTADWSIQWKYEDGKSINKYYNETFGGEK